MVARLFLPILVLMHWKTMSWLILDLVVIVVIFAAIKLVMWVAQP